jgi:hypothetical protein
MGNGGEEDGNRERFGCLQCGERFFKVWPL